MISPFSGEVNIHRAFFSLHIYICSTFQPCYRSWHILEMSGDNEPSKTRRSVEFVKISPIPAGSISSLILLRTTRNARQDGQGLATGSSPESESPCHHYITPAIPYHAQTTSKTTELTYLNRGASSASVKINDSQYRCTSRVTRRSGERR